MKTFSSHVVLVVAWFGVACAPGPVGGRSDGGSAPDAGEPPAFGFNFGEPVNVGPDDPSGNGGLGLAVSDSGEISVLYFIDLETTQECVTNFDTKQVAESQLKLARGDGETFTVSVVDTTRSADGVSAAYDNNGNLQVAYVGGPNGTGSCAASDLLLASYTGASPAISTLAADSAGSGTCRLQQNACNTGNVVGRFVSLAFNDDNQRFISFQDTHFDFSVETDFEGADLEVLVDGTRYTVDDSSGAGNQGSMFVGEGGRAAVAHVVIVDHTFEGEEKAKGVWLAQQNEDNTWESVLVDGNVVPTNQIGGAFHATRGYAIAYQHPVDKDLLLATSVDGTTWNKTQVDRLGNVGATPAVAFHGDRIVIAYNACSGAQDTGGNCNPARDGVRLAVEDNGEWNVQTVFNDPDFIEGTDVRMAVASDNSLVVAFKSQGTRKVKVVRGTPR
ncbi:MAG: hypothetical protein AB2A00_15185 [Myxococcota bacterium]